MSNRKLPIASLAVTAFLASLSSATAAPLTYTETASGPLSNDSSTPTPLTFDVGVNSVSGQAGFATIDNVRIRKPVFFTFTLPPTQQITAIQYVQTSYTGASFVGIASGVGVADTTDGNSLLAYGLVGTTSGDILPNLALRQLGAITGGAGGLSNPIAPGTYTWWFQETAALIPFEFRFTVAVVPEPSLSIAGAAFVPLLLRRRPAHRA